MNYRKELDKLQQADSILSKNIVAAQNRVNDLIDEQEQIRELIRNLGKAIMEKKA